MTSQTPSRKQTRGASKTAVAKLSSPSSTNSSSNFHPRRNKSFFTKKRKSHTGKVSTTPGTLIRISRSFPSPISLAGIPRRHRSPVAIERSSSVGSRLQLKSHRIFTIQSSPISSPQNLANHFPTSRQPQAETPTTNPSKMPRNILSMALLVTAVQAVAIDLYNDSGCNLLYESLDTPSNAGCTSLNANGESIRGVVLKGGFTSSCFLYFYSDASCNDHQLLLSQANADST
ncbi:hypothetical protein M409DRAFT_58456 [Zasmidium cellare ATCC 36951]|uniref:Uncharacterized protein n=1 Tax=Zasmidium cellare ATCC 36951 TaxID=1080233 RepID=A0A6A6C8Y2_ZASCE|nr:uncharacterized protein M409DRAFT_58456 [Zasmidium cellare ATCC 36951]KAF2162362.1 hypothetical protein M409DRAFT_58456 [Zasmidium cellare ATCC 36951]